MRPLVTLHLHSGRDVVGTLLDFFEPRGAGSRTLLLARRACGQGPDTELLLVPVAHLEAVTLHELPRPAPATQPEPPSPLQLRRQARAVAEQVSNAAGGAIHVEVAATTDDASLGAVAQALTALAAVASGVCADALGREAFKSAVTRVLVAAGPSSSVTLRDAVLSVTTATSADRLTARTLKPLLEALL